MRRIRSSEVFVSAAVGSDATMGSPPSVQPVTTPMQVSVMRRMTNVPDVV